MTAIPAINYAGAVSQTIKSKGLEIYNDLKSRKKVTLTHIWGKGAGGDHKTGRALDFMIFSNVAAGHYIANYAMANASRLGIDYIMWNHRIWNPKKDKYGAWRWVPDRGNSTENHLDHVHISFLSAAGKYTAPTGNTTPQPAPKPTTPGKLPAGALLSEDGKNGPGTRKAIQRMLSASRVDGVWGPNTRMGIQRWAGVKPDGNMGPATRRAVQRKLGVKQTGVWDWDQSVKADPTTKALQKYYNNAVRARGKAF